MQSIRSEQQHGAPSAGGDVAASSTDGRETRGLPAPELRPGASSALESRIAQAGSELVDALNRLLEGVPEAEQGPQRLAKRLGVDKVLTSRLLKAVRSDDPMYAIHRMPGPEPLRRVVKASAKAGASADVIESASGAVDRFDRLIRVDVGDRSALEALLSAWVPEARREFELRRKQAAFRAMSQIKGTAADLYAEAAMLWPSTDGEHVDVVWIKMVLGLHRLRPGVRVRLSSMRSVESPTTRRPSNLDGEPIDRLGAAVMDEFSTAPAEAINTIHAGEQIHYLLSESAFGAERGIDLCTCEVNLTELPRYIPAERNRKAWFSSELALPAKRHQFDCFVHPELFRGATPTLRLFDTAIHGLVDVNDPMTPIDELELSETLQPLGRGIGRARATGVPHYHRLLTLVCEKLNRSGDELIGHRCDVAYPLYGTQMTMVFDTVPPPPSE